jgi:hypothetical protein
MTATGECSGSSSAHTTVSVTDWLTCELTRGSPLRTHPVVQKVRLGSPLHRIVDIIIMRVVWVVSIDLIYLVRNRYWTGCRRRRLFNVIMRIDSQT